MTPDLLTMAQTYAAAAGEGEACGLVVVAPGDHVGRYVPVRNLSEVPDRFTIHPEDWAEVEDRGRVAAVVHSHPATHPEPSGADRMACDLSGIPWAVVSGDAWTVMQPMGLPFEGREFCWGVSDCYSLVRDWFIHDRGIVLPDFLRGPEFWKFRDLFGESLSRAGFQPADGDPVPGDGLLFSIRGQGITNHCAVYMGGGQMLHHLPGRLSVVEPIGAWARCLIQVVRHG